MIAGNTLEVVHSPGVTEYLNHICIVKLLLTISV